MSKPAGAQGGAEGIRWEAVASGWAIAVLVATVIDPVLVLLYGLFAAPPVVRVDLTATVVVVSVVSGFLSYLIGGYVAARMACYSGGKHGALTAAFGLGIGIAMGIVLALLGLVFTNDITTLPADFGLPDVVPPISFGLAGPALIAGTILFLINLFGGFVGGRLGEPPCPDEKPSR